MAAVLAMTAGQHLRLCGTIDVQPLLRVLPAWEPLFDAVRWRQETKGSPHADTKTIFLRMPAEITVETVFQSLEAVDLPPMDEPAFRTAVEAVSDLEGAPVARVMIVKLRPGGIILPHVDEGAYAEATDRYHLCVETNPLCHMQVGGEVVRPKAGEVWSFDKRTRHMVANGGTTWRTHLIVDCWRQPA